MFTVELANRVGDDCYSAFMVWRSLPATIEQEGTTYHKLPLDLRRDGFFAAYRIVPPCVVCAL